MASSLLSGQITSKIAKQVSIEYLLNLILKFRILYDSYTINLVTSLVHKPVFGFLGGGVGVKQFKKVQLSLLNQ